MPTEWATIAKPETVTLESHCTCEEDCYGHLCFQDSYSYLEDTLFPEYLARNNKPEFIKIYGQTIGWQRLSGYAIKEADFTELYKTLTLNGDWRLEFSLAGRNLIVNRYSHDEPTGCAFTITPTEDKV